MCLVHLLGPPSLAQMHLFASFDHTLPLLECLKKFPQMVVQSLLPSSPDFMRKSDIKHRVSSAYFPQSNGRTEVAVKAAKRLLKSNISPNGDLNNDSFLRALLQLRNTPDPDCDFSPAEMVFGHPLRDAFSFVNRLATFSNRFIRRTWREAWRAKEDALRFQAKRTNDALSARTRPLRPLRCGDRVFIQNQGGRHPRKWDKVGTVFEALDVDQYNVKVGRSGRITRRNRRFLRVIPDVAESQQTSSTPTVPPQHETHVQHPPSTSTHVVDATSSEAIDHGQPHDVHDDLPTATHPTFVTDTNSQETETKTTNQCSLDGPLAYDNLLSNWIRLLVNG